MTGYYQAVWDPQHDRLTQHIIWPTHDCGHTLVCLSHAPFKLSVPSVLTVHCYQIICLLSPVSTYMHHRSKPVSRQAGSRSLSSSLLETWGDAGITVWHRWTSSAVMTLYNHWSTSMLQCKWSAIVKVFVHHAGMTANVMWRMEKANTRRLEHIYWHYSSPDAWLPWRQQFSCLWKLLQHRAAEALFSRRWNGIRVVSFLIEFANAGFPCWLMWVCNSSCVLKTAELSIRAGGFFPTMLSELLTTAELTPIYLLTTNSCSQLWQLLTWTWRWTC